MNLAQMHPEATKYW